MAKHKKRPHLSDEQRLAIVKTKRKRPNWPVRLIAGEHNVTISQVRTALEKYDRGELGSKSHRKRKAVRNKIAEVREAIASGEMHTMLNDIATDLIAEIKASPDLAIKEKASLLNQTARSVKILLDSSITHNIKNPDAQSVWALAQELRPGITQQELIEIWKKIRN